MVYITLVLLCVYILTFPLVGVLFIRATGNILIKSTVVSRVSAHGRSTITPRFSVYWALTRDTGRLPCVKIEIGGADCVGVATTKRVRVEIGIHAGSSSI